MSVTPTKFLQTTPPVDFQNKAGQKNTSVATCFMENERGEILLLKRSKKEDQSYTWGVPGGKIEATDASARNALVRELQEETGLSFNISDFTSKGKRYVRIPKWDYVLHLFHVHIKGQQTVTISDEHTEAKWVPKARFNSLPLLKGQDEAFRIVYGDQVWDRTVRTDKAAKLVFEKGNKEVVFDERRRLIINVLGTSGSGKGTQGVMLAERYGIAHISVGDLFRDQFRNKTNLGDLIAYHDQIRPTIYSPDEICLGIMAKRFGLSDCKNGFILDGFPRTAGQAAITINTFLRPDDVLVNVYMDLPESVIRQRIKDRYICQMCGHQVRGHDNLKRPGYCPKPDCTDSRLVRRAEDVNQTKLERRFKTFRDNKDSVFSTLKSKAPIPTIALRGHENPLEVFADVSSKIDTTFNRLGVDRTPIVKPTHRLSNRTWLLGAIALVGVGAIIAAGRKIVSRRG